MHTTMSIRDLTRSGSLLQDYDYIDIEDKKSHEYKGVFVPQKYADDIKHYLAKKLEKETNQKVDSILQFAGIMEGESEGKSIQELKARKEEK